MTSFVPACKSPVAVKSVVSNSSFVLRLWELGELQQGLRGPAGLSRGLAVAGQPAGCGLPPLWRSRHLPLLDSHRSTLHCQVRPLHQQLLTQWSWSDPAWIYSLAVSLPCRSSSPGDWVVYAGIVDPLGTLFNPAYSVSRITAHEGFNSLTRRNDIALMRLSKPLDITGALHTHRCKNTQCKTFTKETEPHSAKLSPS